MSATCPRCGGQNGSHGMVHMRHPEGGGGSNVVCPAADPMPAPASDDKMPDYDTDPTPESVAALSSIEERLADLGRVYAEPAPTADPVGYIDVVFDGPPSHESGRFVEVEDPSGASIGVGEWIDRGNGLWALRIPVTAHLIGETT